MDAAGFSRRLVRPFVTWWILSIALGMVFATLMHEFSILFLSVPGALTGLFAVASCVLIPFAVGITGHISPKGALVVTVIFVATTSILLIYVLNPLNVHLALSGEFALMRIQQSFSLYPVNALANALCYDPWQTGAGSSWLCDTYPGAFAVALVAMFLSAASMQVAVYLRARRPPLARWPPDHS